MSYGNTPTQFDIDGFLVSLTIVLAGFISIIWFCAMREVYRHYRRTR